MKKTVESKEGQVLICTHTPNNRDYRIPVGIYTVEYDRFEDRKNEDLGFSPEPMYYLKNIHPMNDEEKQEIRFPSAEYDYYLKHNYMSWGFQGECPPADKLAS